MIYLIINESNTHCKIGVANNPEKRLLQLQTGNAEKLRLEIVIDGSFKGEKRIHNKFKSLKVANEWFKYHNDILDYFKFINQCRENTVQTIELTIEDINKLVSLSPNAIRAALLIYKNQLLKEPFNITALNICSLLGVSSRTTGTNIMQELKNNLKLNK